MIYSIAIDGPVGAGKSSVADAVAESLGILHLDTGAMYRAFAWQALQEGISSNDEKALGELTKRLLPEVRFVDGMQRTLIGGRDVTDLIRTPEISMAASNASKFAVVRKAMVARQQELARAQSIVMDGRDIGTVVLPDATLKIYLTASAEERAKRRYKEMLANGQEADYEQVLADVKARDHQDTHRKVTPLRCADDAVRLDSSFKSQKQVIEEILRLLRLKQGQKPLPAEPINRVYAVTIRILAFLYKTLFPVEFHHKEKAMLSGPFLLIANHNHALDPFMAGYPLSYSYQVRFLGKKELTKTKIAQWYLCKGLGMISVERNASDMHAMRACLKTLKEGHVLGIFPEGTRHKEGVMQDIESGTAMIAMMSKCPLLPCYLEGSWRLFRKAHVYYGDAFSLNDIAEKGVNSKTAEEATERIKSVYRDLYEAVQKEKTKGKHSR